MNRRWQHHLAGSDMNVWWQHHLVGSDKDVRWQHHLGGVLATDGRGGGRGDERAAHPPPNAVGAPFPILPVFKHPLQAVERFP
jgi:hypothetical protein